MDEFFQRVFSDPKPTRCLGVSLVPLTVGHFIFLREFNSPFVSDQQSGIEDLILACYVCCQDCESARKHLKSKLLPIAMHFWGRRARKCNLVLETMKFQSYIKAATAIPRIAISCHDGESMRTLNSPMEWRLLVMLMNAFGLTEKQALATTMLKANALWATLGDMDGKLNLLSEQTQTLIELQQRGAA